MTDVSVCEPTEGVTLQEEKEIRYPHGWVGSIQDGMVCVFCGLEATSHDERRAKSTSHNCVPQGGHEAFMWRNSEEGQQFERRRAQMTAPITPLFELPKTGKKTSRV